MANIRELGSGKWQVQVRHRGMRPAVKSFKTKTEAARWARLLESEVDRGVFVDRSDCEQTTVGELIDRYLSEVTPKKKSVRSEKQRLNALKSHFGAFSLASVRSSHISAYRDAKIKAGLAGATVVKDLNSLSHLFEVAIKDWGLPLIPDTKTGDARKVPLSTAALAAISPLPRHFKDGRVFWTWKRTDSLENAWRRAVKAAGITDFRFHDLRHEAVSRLVERGLNVMEVSAISGHKTLQMLRRYTHLKAEELVKKLG